MKVVSVINYKGGVGKTTLTANLGAQLAAQGKRILMIDLDPQTNLTFSFVKPDYWKETYEAKQTIKSWFESFTEGTPFDLRTLIFSPGRVSRHVGDGGKLDLISSHLGLINVDLELATELGGASLTRTRQSYLRVHRRLAQGLATITDDDYDLILIDCPPNFNVVTKTAIVASEFLLIPARPDYLSTLGIDYLIGKLRELTTEFNEFARLVGTDQREISPQILGVAFTMVQEYGNEPIAAIRPYIAQTKKLQTPVFDAYIKENKTIFGDAPEFGIPVVLLPASNDSHRGVISGLKRFVAEFEDRLSQAQL